MEIQILAPIPLRFCNSILRIPDFKKEFNTKINEMLQEHELHKKQIQALRLLEQKEDQLHKNISLINDMRKVILHRYCKK
jgi:hypothetical protein